MLRRTVLTCMACLLFIGSMAAEPAKKKKRGTRNRVVEPAVMLTPESVNIADWNAVPGPGVLRAQILLDRAHFSPGEIDGKTGANFQRAIRAFQQSRQLAASGALDEPTWTSLTADTAPALVPYRITEADVAGPFAPVPDDLMEQAKMKQVGYTSPDEALGELFHLNPALLKQLNPAATFAANEEIQVPNVLTTAAGKAARLVVAKSGTLTAFDAGGKVIAHYPASSGSEKDPLPIGEWKITGIFRDPPFFYNPDLFWDADPSHSKAKIPPGPNNPVGPTWIDLTKEHYGIHGTPAPGNVGHTQSHGCIRLTNWDVKELAGLVGKGIAVSMVAE